MAGTCQSYVNATRGYAGKSRTLLRATPCGRTRRQESLMDRMGVFAARILGPVTAKATDSVRDSPCWPNVAVLEVPLAADAPPQALF